MKMHTVKNINVRFVNVRTYIRISYYVYSSRKFLLLLLPFLVSYSRNLGIVTVENEFWKTESVACDVTAPRRQPFPRNFQQ